MKLLLEDNFFYLLQQDRTYMPAALFLKDTSMIFHMCPEVSRDSTICISYLHDIHTEYPCPECHNVPPKALISLCRIINVDLPEYFHETRQTPWIYKEFIGKHTLKTVPPYMNRDSINLRILTIEQLKEVYRGYLTEEG